MSDVCLLLEGTFPYIAGGVSTWVYNLIKSLPEINFSIILISPYADSARKYKYPIPDNIVSINEIYLHDYKQLKYKLHRDTKKWEKLIEFYNCILEGNIDKFENICDLIANEHKRSMSWKEFFFSRKTFKLLEEYYKKQEYEHSFIDFFWTWRFTHLPLFNVITARLPRAKVYHTISTGYSGLLSAVAKIKFDAPVLLTEHGIYTNERKIEITTADWIFEEEFEKFDSDITLPFFKKWWINFFGFMSKITYKYADEIITLFSGNQLLQIEDGAPPEKLSIIPNGINLNEFYNLNCVIKREPDIFYIGFVGRVVAIKDVKTFIKSVKIVSEKIENIKVLIIGPTDEEPDYYKECAILTKMLALEQVIEFTGKIDVKEYYSCLDVVVLTSISEAQPLVILEANCLGIPCVASNVGACEELLYGRAEEDKSLGASGIVTDVASPEQTADAIIKILTEKELKDKMGQTGIKRVRTYYAEKELTYKYFDMYREYMNKSIEN